MPAFTSFFSNVVVKKESCFKNCWNTKFIMYKRSPFTLTCFFFLFFADCLFSGVGFSDSLSLWMKCISGAKSKMSQFSLPGVWSKLLQRGDQEEKKKMVVPQSHGTCSAYIESWSLTSIWIPLGWWHHHFIIQHLWGIFFVLVSVK